MRASGLFFLSLIALLISCETSIAQTAVAFGGAASAARSLASAPMLHAGVYCINYSGLESTPTRIRAIRGGPIAIPPFDSNGVSTAQWENVLKDYDRYEKELRAAGILSSELGLAQQKLLALSAAGLSPLRKQDKQVDSQMKMLTRRDAISKMVDEFEAQDELIELSKEEAVESFGSENDYKARLAQGYVSEKFGAVYDAAGQSNSIAPGVASLLIGRNIYLQNVKQWDMPPEQLRAQAQAEYAFALFNDRKYVEARANAYKSLAVLGENPEPYVVTVPDHDGHRRTAYSRNLAFLIAKLSDFYVAKQSNDAVAGLKSAIELLQQAPSIDHILWYLTEIRHWEAGKLAFNALLEHAAINLPVAINPKTANDKWVALQQAVHAVWHDPSEQKTYVTLSGPKNARERPVSFVISGAGAPPLPPSGPPNAMQFGGGGTNRQFAFIAGDDGRNQLLKFLRAQIDRYSTADVALFATIKEVGRVRVILPSNRLDALKGRLEEYDSFTITDAEMKDLSKLDSGHPLAIFLAGLKETALTMYAAPHSVVPGEFQQSSDDFAFRLAASRRDLAVFRDYFTEETVPRSRSLIGRQFGEPGQYVVLTATKDTQIRDWGLIANIRKAYIDRFKVPVLSYDGKNAASLGAKLGGNDLNIILITAHAAPELMRMIYDLGKAGAFKDNVVVFMSCRTEITRHLTEVVGGFGAKGVVVTDRVVPRDDADAALRGLFKRFEDEASKSRPFRQVIFEVFQNFGGLISVSWMKLWGVLHG